MRLPAETVQVSYLAGQGSDSASFTGTRLLNVFAAAGGAQLRTDVNNARLRMTVMVTGADGYQVAFGWGELDPEFGAAPIMLAYARALHEVHAAAAPNDPPPESGYRHIRPKRPTRRHNCSRWGLLPVGAACLAHAIRSKW